MNQDDLANFVGKYFVRSGKLVPARIQCCIALTERLRSHPVLELEVHLSKAGQALIGHESYGDAALARLGVLPVNKNHGRRSSSIHEWGQEYLEIIAGAGFESASDTDKANMLDGLQAELAMPLRQFHEQEPICVRVRGRTAESVVTEILLQAEQKGRADAVAQYLVGAKLRLRFPSLSGRIAVLGANKGDRKNWGDSESRRGDFDLGDCVFEVALGMPDSKHLNQMRDIIKDRDTEAWLLVRRKRLRNWMDEVEESGIDQGRVVVASVELFVGQNVAELGELNADGQVENLKKLVRIYNEEWVSSVGSSGIRIEIK